MKTAKERLIQIAIKHNIYSTEEQIRRDFEDMKDESMILMYEIMEEMRQYAKEAAKEQRHNCTEALVFAYSDNCNNPNYIVPESVVFNAKTPEIL